ncbi:MAG TPA: DNRLRE domain-containing protein [Polyangiaceae bacterium]|nr:DNRLRE domain-containing protein [Polyangiaceae bacterium]
MKHTTSTLGRARSYALLALLGGIFAGCGQAPAPESTAGISREALSASFRVGEAGYTSSDDVTISNQSGGNGTTDRSATQVLSWKKTGTDAYEISALIRFNNVSLPAGSQVSAAQLTLTFENWWTGFTLRGYYVKNAWNAASSAPLGWLNRDTGLTWATPGVKGVGTDIVAGSSFSNSSWVGNGDEVKTFDLDPAIVQSWIDNPATNQGVVLVNNESDDKYLRIYSSEDSVVSRRPRLSITYSSGSGGGGTGGAGGGGNAGGHPRIFLDAATLSSLRGKAQASAGAWTTLRATCNSYLNGTTKSVCYPPPDPLPASCNPYPNLPDVGEGYQGDDYAAAVLNLGVCYQIGLGIADANTSAWGARGADVLAKMTEFTGYQRDSGYGIRNYGVGMALGFDFLYPALSASVKSQVSSSLNAWLSWYDNNGLARTQPHANYFAGYYAAKAYAALATEGDNASAPAAWSDFLDRLQRGTVSGAPHGGVAPYYTANLTGGGWYEGWQYGNLAVQNMSLPALAARTAKNLDLIQDAAKPYRYPLESAAHLMHFSWPSRDELDERDTLHSGSVCRSNARPAAQLLAVASTLLAKWNDPLAAQFHRFARDARSATGNSGAAPWSEFLFWDEAASESDYSTLAKSYRATNYAAMRSDWTTSASWASFRASAYVDAIDSTEQYPDPGALAITRGNMPFLVNPEFLHTCYGGTPPTNYNDQIYAEVYGGPQRFFNTFYNGSGPVFRFVPVDDTPAPATRIASFEDGGGYVLARAKDLEDVFQSAANVSLWTRDVLFFRPSVFVVYDHTTVGNTSGDQHMNWNFAPTPAYVSSPSSGAKRYDVGDTLGFKGAITTLLPANANGTIVDVFGSHKLYRVEVRPASSSPDSRWLTVLDTASSAAGVRTASVVSSSSNVTGALIADAGGNFVGLFGTNPGQTVSGAITFTEPAQATKLVVSDLAPNSTYSVSVQVSGNHAVTVQPGSGFTSSANGTLYVNIAANGVVTSGS